MDGGSTAIARCREEFMHPEGLAVFWGDIDRAKNAKTVPAVEQIDAQLCALLPWWNGILALLPPQRFRLHL